MLTRTSSGGGSAKDNSSPEVEMGVPEKLPDVCYSWWVLSSLIMIDRVHQIDKKKLDSFILDCQDKENGGISDRPDDPNLKATDPANALPVDAVNKIFLGK